MGCNASSVSLEEKVEMLQSTPFMLHLNHEQLSHLARHTLIRRYPASTRIFAEGELGTEFFIIGAGEVDITARDEQRHEQFLCSKKKGDFFGESAITNENDGKHVRTATVTTSDACTMLVINQKAYKQYLSECDDKIKTKVEEMIGERMVNVLKKIEWLSSLSEWKLQLLGNLFRYRTMQENEVVFHEGDMGRSLFLISQGSVRVTARGEDDVQLHLADLTAGTYFGEIALMVDMPRTATVTANERCLLLVLGIDDFRNFLHVVPDLKEKFEKVVKDRTAEHFQKFKVPFFASIPRDRFKELADYCSMQAYNVGQVIFNEGDAGNAFFLMVYGEVSVIKDEHEVGVLGPGKYFGEIALVTDLPRTATVKAKSRSVLLSLTKDNFMRFFASNPEAYADFALKISRYEVPLRSVLVHRTGRKYFAEHLASEYSTENLEFWDAVSKYETLLDNANNHDGRSSSSSNGNNSVIFPESTTNISAASSSSSSSSNGNGTQTSAAGSNPNFSTPTPTNAIHPTTNNNNDNTNNNNTKSNVNGSGQSTPVQQPTTPLSEEKKTLLRGAAASIIDKYIDDHADKQVNIPSRIREAVVARFKTGEISTHLFDDAKDEVVKLMSSDSFKRFKESDLFKKLLDEVGTYADEPHHNNNTTNPHDNHNNSSNEQNGKNKLTLAKIEDFDDEDDEEDDNDDDEDDSDEDDEGKKQYSKEEKVDEQRQQQLIMTSSGSHSGANSAGPSSSVSTPAGAKSRLAEAAEKYNKTQHP